MTDRRMHLAPMAIITLCALLGSCATEKQLKEHDVRTIVADMLVQQAAQDTHVNEQTLNVDSIVSSSVRTAMSEWQQSETSKETTTETITTWVDSLGREMRQEQRTTQREQSRQEQQRQQELLHQMQIEMQQQLSERDSVWSHRIAQIESHLIDSLSHQRDVAQKSDTATSLKQSRSWLKGVLAGALLAIVLICGYRLERRLNDMS